MPWRESKPEASLSVVLWPTNFPSASSQCVKGATLPNETIGQDYELEYGNDRVEIHRDAISPGEKVLLIDDLLAYRRDCDSHSEPPPPHGGRRRSVWIRYKPARARGPKAPRKRRCARPDPY